MKISAARLSEIIREELHRASSSLLSEGCGEEAETGHKCPGCAQGNPCSGCGDDHGHGHEDLLSKKEALEIVMQVAQKTSCPMTQDVLMDVVSNLSDEDQSSGHRGVSCEVAHPEEPHEAWAQGNRAEIPDLGQLAPSAAFGIGHDVGSGRITDYDISG